MQKCKVVIIGGGIAGLSASLYLSRNNIEHCIIDKSDIGGKLNYYTEINNFSGLPNLKTDSLLDNLELQLDINKPNKLFLNTKVDEIDFTDKKIYLENNDIIEYEELILASGSEQRKLNIDGEEKFLNKGVHYCVHCDGTLYKNKITTVIGGGNTALESALYLSNICKRVNIIYRGTMLKKAEKKLIKGVYKKKNIRVFINTDILEITGANKVESISIRDKSTGELEYVNTDAIFPCIGFIPSFDNFVKTDSNMFSEYYNCYVIGDARDKEVKQVNTAISDGVIAACSIIKKCSI